MTLTTTGQFLNRSTTPKYSSEYSMAESYRNAEKALEEAQKCILSCIRVRVEDDGTYTPIFADGVAEHVENLAAAEKRVNEVDADIREYLKNLGEFDSINGMTEMLARHRRAQENAKHDATAILERVIRKSGKSSSEASLSEAAAVAADKADRMEETLRPKVDDLLARIKTCRSILERYA